MVTCGDITKWYSVAGLSHNEHGNISPISTVVLESVEAFSYFHDLPPYDFDAIQKVKETLRGVLFHSRKDVVNAFK